MCNLFIGACSSQYLLQIFDCYKAFFLCIKKIEELLKARDTCFGENPLFYLFISIWFHFFVSIKVSVVLITPESDGLDVLGREIGVQLGDQIEELNFAMLFFV